MMNYTPPMLTVRIPKKNREYFNLYANGVITEDAYDDERGALFSMGGTVVLQYKYPHHRRTYIVKNADEYKTIPPDYLPNVRERVGIISFLYGRRIDLLQQAIYKAERIAGKEIYLYPVIFWQKMTCLLESNNGQSSAVLNSNLLLLCKKYGRQ